MLVNCSIKIKYTPVYLRNYAEPEREKKSSNANKKTDRKKNRNWKTYECEWVSILFFVLASVGNVPEKNIMQILSKRVYTIICVVRSVSLTQKTNSHICGNRTLPKRWTKHFKLFSVCFGYLRHISCQIYRLNFSELSSISSNSSEQELQRKAINTISTRRWFVDWENRIWATLIPCFIFTFRCYFQIIKIIPTLHVPYLEVYIAVVFTVSNNIRKPTYLRYKYNWSW